MLRARGTAEGTKPISPFSSLTSSWIVFSPDSERYSSSLPGIDASAIVTWTPRIVFGGDSGLITCFEASGTTCLTRYRRLRRLGAAISCDLCGIGDAAGHQHEHDDRSHPARAPTPALLPAALAIVSRAINGLENHGTGSMPLSARSRFRPKCPCKHGKPERAGSAP